MAKHPGGSSHNTGHRNVGKKAKGKSRVKKMGADVSGKFGTAHNSSPFKKTGSLSSGPMKTIKSPPQNRPGGNLGNAGQKGTT